MTVMDFKKWKGMYNFLCPVATINAFFFWVRVNLAHPNQYQFDTLLSCLRHTTNNLTDIFWSNFQDKMK